MNEHEKKPSEADSSGTEMPAVETADAADEKSLDRKIRDLVGPFFEENKVEEAIVVAKEPTTGKVALFYRGHFYDVTVLLSDIYKKFRSAIEKELV